MSLRLLEALGKVSRKNRITIFLGTLLDGLEAKRVFQNQLSLSNENLKLLEELLNLPFDLRVCLILTYLRRYNARE